MTPKTPESEVLQRYRAAPDSARAAPSAGVVAAAVAGNALEFYDFLTYSFFAVYIGHAFFPADSATTSLLLSVAVFGVGFLTRPLGGVLIGAYADRVGRKPAMLLTIALITVGTLGLALTPSYAQIGMAAPVLVVLCRLIQGLALGGEVGPSTTFLVEIAPDTRRGYFASWQIASQGVAVLAAGLMGAILSTELRAEQLDAWGWRVPFLLGVPLLPLAAYLRRRMPETLYTGAAAAPSGRGLGSYGATYGTTLVLTILVVLGGTVSTYVGSYMTTYAITTLHMADAVAMGATVVQGIATLAFALLGGLLADRYGRKPAMLIPRIGLLLLTYPAFQCLVGTPTPSILFLVTGGLSALTALSVGASMVLVPELFPREIRVTALAIVYAVGVALFGGSTQFVVTWLIGVLHNPLAPALYATVASVLTVAAMLALPETRRNAV